MRKSLVYVRSCLSLTAAMLSSAALAQSPHITVSNVTAPKYAFVGRTVDIEFTLTNDGTGDVPVGADAGFEVQALVHPSFLGDHFTPHSSRTASSDTLIATWDGFFLRQGCQIEVKNGAVIASNSDGGPCYADPPQIDGGIPSIPGNNAFGSPLQTGDYVLGIVVDATFLSNPDAGHPWEGAASTDTSIPVPGPDYTVLPGDLSTLAATIAGNTLFVLRTITNLGLVTEAAPYSYFLTPVSSPNDAGLALEVPILVGDGVSTLGASPPIPYDGSGMTNTNTATDTVLIPGSVAPGNYLLTISLDPRQTTSDLDRTNNLTSSAPIAISASSFHIQTDTLLPTGVAGEPYSTTLYAIGGTAGYTWTLVAGTLPASLKLAVDGTLSGSPTADDLGTFAFVAEVQSGKQTQFGEFTLTIEASGVPLSIQTELGVGGTLLTAVVGTAYSQTLTAQGGVPPYTFSGTLPGDGSLALHPDGTIAGTPDQASVTSAPTPFTVTVTDATGGQASATLVIAIVDALYFAITTDPAACDALGTCPTSIPLQSLGFPVTGFTFTAVEGDERQHSYTWTFPAGQTLPLGLVAGPSPASPGDNTFALTGTPTQAGSFPFELVATDETGRSVSQTFTLTVVANPIPSPPRKSGCGTAPGDLLVLSALAGLGLVRRRTAS